MPQAAQSGGEAKFSRFWCHYLQAHAHAGTRALHYIGTIIGLYASNAYRVRVLGKFPTSGDETVIPLELVLGAVRRNLSTLDYHPVWRVDVAR